MAVDEAPRTTLAPPTLTGDGVLEQDKGVVRNGVILPPPALRAVGDDLMS